MKEAGEPASLASALLLGRSAGPAGAGRRRVGVAGSAGPVGIIRAVAECGCVLQIGFGHLDHGAVWPAVSGARTGRCRGSSRAGAAGRRRLPRRRRHTWSSRGGHAARRVGAGRGGLASRGLSLGVGHPLNLVIGNGDVLLANAEEAADTDDDRVDLAILADQHLVDVADLLVVGA